MKFFLLLAALLSVANSQEAEPPQAPNKEEQPPVQIPNVAPQYSARRITSDGIFAQELSNLGNGVLVPSSRYFFLRHNGETRGIKEGDQFFTNLSPHEPDPKTKKPKVTMLKSKAFDTYNPGTILIIRPLLQGRTLTEQTRINAIPQSFVTVAERGSDWILAIEKGEASPWFISTKETKILSIPVGQQFGARMSREADDENRDGKIYPSYRIEEISKLPVEPKK